MRCRRSPRFSGTTARRKRPQVLRLDLQELEDRACLALRRGHAGPGGHRHDRVVRTRRPGLRRAQRRADVRIHAGRLAASIATIRPRSTSSGRSLTDGGSEVQCGWLKDRYGLSWQVVPTILSELVTAKQPGKSAAVMQALMQMVKLDIAKLQQAYDRA